MKRLANEINVEALKRCLQNSPTQALDPNIIDEVGRQLDAMGCLGPPEIRDQVSTEFKVHGVVLDANTGGDKA